MKLKMKNESEKKYINFLIYTYLKVCFLIQKLKWKMKWINEWMNEWMNDIYL